MRRLQVEEENDGLAFDKAVHLGDQVVDMDLVIYGVPVRLAKGRFPWLGLCAIKHFDVVVFYGRTRLESHVTAPATTIAAAAEELFTDCMTAGWGEARQEFVTTLSGARRIRSVLAEIGVTTPPAAA